MKYRNMFQYISCYSLSGEDSSKNYEASVFQYISCYSLSWISCSFLLHLHRVSIHLMLLFIGVEASSAFWKARFNTSHVTLYQDYPASGWSIIELFQYISCYSLSVSANLLHNQKDTFQYISCYSLSRRKRN